ncbi:hypothetical protein J6590_027686 [Homalodisca vitripennis]|nr:hypothetical protein J6590_027686 [Homalodisca vitripennis]
MSGKVQAGGGIRCMRLVQRNNDSTEFRVLIRTGEKAEEAVRCGVPCRQAVLPTIGGNWWTSVMAEIVMACATERGVRCEVRAKKLCLTQSGDQPTTTNGRAGRLPTRTGSLSGHPSKQQALSTLLHSVILRYPSYRPYYAIGIDVYCNIFFFKYF